MRILIIEDEADIRDLLRMVLEEAGHEPVFAGTCAAAERLLRLRRWDMMITDQVLPDGDGLTLAHQARQIDLPTLLCTGHPHEAEQLEAQGIDYLQKPFSLTALLGKIGGLTALAA